MIIALSGEPGAGKSTVKHLLTNRLQLKSYSMGDLRGKMALAQGITIDELNARGMNDIASDQEVDAFQTKLGETENNFIIDGWLSWHFIPNAFKVKLVVDPAIAAERIFQARSLETDRNDEPEYTSVAETQDILAKRVEQNEARYQKWYGISLKNDGKYDVTVDTSHLTPDEVVDAILAAIPKNLDPQP